MLESTDQFPACARSKADARRRGTDRISRSGDPRTAGGAGTGDGRIVYRTFSSARRDRSAPRIRAGSRSRRGNCEIWCPRIPCRRAGQDMALIERSLLTARRSSHLLVTSQRSARCRLRPLNVSRAMPSSRIDQVFVAATGAFIVIPFFLLGRNGSGTAAFGIARHRVFQDFHRRQYTSHDAHFGEIETHLDADSVPISIRS